MNIELISPDEFLSLDERCNLSFFSGSKILITGGAGMVGSWIANTLLRTPGIHGPSNVTVVSRRSHPSNLASVWSSPKFQYIQGSVDGTELKGFDFIFHAASPASPTKYKDPESIFKANAVSAKQLINSSPGLTQFIYISSGEIYGVNAPVNVSENFIGTFVNNLNRSSYPQAKLETERILSELSSSLGFKSTVIRLFHTFGPGLAMDDGRSFADFIWAVARGESPTLYTRGEQIRAFLYMEDAIAGILSAAVHPKSVTVNVGSDQPLSIRSFAEAVCETSSLDLRPNYKVGDHKIELSPVACAVPCNDLLKTLGWYQKYSVPQAIERTISWAKSQNLD